jgi:4-hydroxy-2-oxoheptanedioate aldolase
MADIPRLNGVTRTLEAGKHALTCFSVTEVESALALSTAKYDGVVYEMEHNAYDIRALRDCLQYMLNRRQLVQGGTLAPAVTPMVRIPPNGGEQAQWHAKQVLDLGAYGIIWPDISSVEEAYNAIAACRYPRQPREGHDCPIGKLVRQSQWLVRVETNVHSGIETNVRGHNALRRLQVELKDGL